MKTLSKFCPCLKRVDDSDNIEEPPTLNRNVTSEKLKIPIGDGDRQRGSVTSLASSTQQIPSIHTLELYSPDPDHMTTHSDCSFAVSHERLAFLKRSSSIAVNIPSSRGSLSSLDGRWNSRNTLQLSTNMQIGAGMSEGSKIGCEAVSD